MHWLRPLCQMNWISGAVVVPLLHGSLLISAVIHHERTVFLQHLFKLCYAMPFTVGILALSTDIQCLLTVGIECQWKVEFQTICFDMYASISILTAWGEESTIMMMPPSLPSRPQSPWFPPFGSFKCSHHHGPRWDQEQKDRSHQKFKAMLYWVCEIVRGSEKFRA